MDKITSDPLLLTLKGKIVSQIKDEELSFYYLELAIKNKLLYFLILSKNYLVLDLNLKATKVTH